MHNSMYQVIFSITLLWSCFVVAVLVETLQQPCNTCAGQVTIVPDWWQARASMFQAQPIKLNAVLLTMMQPAENHFQFNEPWAAAGGEQQAKCRVKSHNRAWRLGELFGGGCCWYD